MLGWRLPFRVPAIEELAVPAVSFVILFLAYTSQYLFYYIEPGPLTKGQAIWFNIVVFALWWCYDRACTVEPGRKGWANRVPTSPEDEEDEASDGPRLKKGTRWCKKCECVKPPRAHHCKTCGRCIPKMDHHCPWTSNCVSETTLPHFLRFVFYAVLGMSILMYHLFKRLLVLWGNRNLPAYLGPPTWAMAHLFVLFVVNSFVLFAVGILLVRSVYGLFINTTMIESWEIERHEALVDRSRRTGGYVYANGGQKVRVEHQEFPYDIGIWKNLCQGMGTNIPFLWFMPFGGGPDIKKSGVYETNGFEEEGKVWPPPDPEKMPRVQHKIDEADMRVYGSVAEEKEAFKKRQQKDYERWNQQAEIEDQVDEEEDEEEDEFESEFEEGLDGEPGWTNSDGDRLKDYGVDEDAEILADEDVPLGELLRRRRAHAATMQ